jgi:hypothetical protein
LVLLASPWWVNFLKGIFLTFRPYVGENEFWLI